MKAQWKKGLTYTVDNIRGQLLDSNGFAFILFGSYIYGVTTEVERAVPEAEIPFGTQEKLFVFQSGCEKRLIKLVVKIFIVL